MNLGIVGYRNYNDYEHFKEIVTPFIASGSYAKIITGDAAGADAMARRYAKEHRIPFNAHVADWKRYGKRAGPERNTLVINETDHLIAFLSIQSLGTFDSINKAKAKGIPYTIINI